MAQRLRLVHVLFSTALMAAALVPGAPAQDAKAPPKAGGDKAGWKVLFDGKSLDGWKSAGYTGSGKIAVKDGTITLATGVPMTGVTYTRGDFPKLDYEVSLEGERVEGGDFFATTTFPVGASHCSLVVGGWGGTVVGLSNVNHMDASMNETTSVKEFQNGRWYKVRVRVTKDRIVAWIDDDQVVDLKTEDLTITIRRECDPCTPFGVATWKTAAALRNIKVRPLTDAEKKDPAGK
jgi:hypothetical protein